MSTLNIIINISSTKEHHSHYKQIIIIKQIRKDLNFPEFVRSYSRETLDNAPSLRAEAQMKSTAQRRETSRQMSNLNQN